MIGGSQACRTAIKSGEAQLKPVKERGPEALPGKNFKIR